MHLDTKTKSIPLEKLVKSKFRIFHTRICYLVVTLKYLSNHWADLKKKFCRFGLVRQPLCIKWLTDSFPEVGYKNAQIFFEI